MSTDSTTAASVLAVVSTVSEESELEQPVANTITDARATAIPRTVLLFNESIFFFTNSPLFEYAETPAAPAEKLPNEC